MMSAREGSHWSRTGKDRNDVTFAGCDIPEMWRPRAKRRPEKKFVAMRGAERVFVGGAFPLFSFWEGLVNLATRPGIVRAESMLRAVRTRREAALAGEG